MKLRQDQTSVPFGPRRSWFHTTVINELGLYWKLPPQADPAVIRHALLPGPGEILPDSLEVDHLLVGVLSDPVLKT